MITHRDTDWAWKIPLRDTRGEVIAYALVDEEDYAWLSSFRFSVKRNRLKHDVILYAYTSHRESLTASGPALHRMVMHRHYGDIEGKIVDHKKDTLDNRKDNLRLTDRTGNARNKSKHVQTTYKGVRQIKGYGRYRAYICIEYKQKHIGSFDDPKDAAIAYDLIARQEFGEFAHLNFPHATESDYDRVRMMIAEAKVVKGTSRYRGVSKSFGKWVAQLSTGGQHYRLGRFDSEEEAALAYNEAAAKHFGPKARLNIIK